MAEQTLKEEVSKIIGLHIKDYGWDDAFKAADIQGKLKGTKLQAIVLAVCKRLDEYETTKNQAPKSA